jgi:hypothetical protein
LLFRSGSELLAPEVEVLPSFSLVLNMSNSRALVIDALRAHGPNSGRTHKAHKCKKSMGGVVVDRQDHVSKDRLIRSAASKERLRGHLATMLTRVAYTPVVTLLR